MFIGHPRGGVVYNFGRVYVCLYVCQTRTFESLDVGIHMHIRCISAVYGLSLYMKVIESRSKSQKPKRSKIRIPAM